MDDNRPQATYARADGDNVASSAAGIAFLERGGEMGRRMRAFDWAATPLGPPQGWPQSLRTVVRILLDSRYAMWMLWGPDLTFFCNDAYLPTVGIRRDWVLGARSDKVWAEIWPDIGPRIEHVLATGEATWDQGLRLLLERSGYPEETYHTFSYSPVYDDAGSIAGMLCVVTEDTERRISERRIALLGAIGADLASTNSEADVFAGAARHLAGLPDLPCALVFMRDAGEVQCVLRAGFDDAQASVGDPGGNAPWPIAEVLASGVEQTIELDARFGDLPRGPWPDPPRMALLLPIQQQGHAQPAGVFVAWLNRYRPLDDAYRRFLQLLAAQIASAVARREYAQATRAGEARRRFLLDFADALRAARRPEEVVAVALARIGHELATACAGYVEVERGGGAFRVVAEWRADGAKGRDGERFPIDRFGEEEARRAGLPIVIENTRTHPRAEAWLAEGAGAVLTMPSVTAGRSPAAVWVSMPGPRAWHGDEIALLREAAERVWAELGRARAETALRESEERFRTMADSSPLLVWVVDPQGRAVFSNRACHEFFGGLPARLAPDGWLAYLHPEDADGYLAEVLGALAARRPFSVMARVRRSDGAWRWIQSIGAPRFSEDGEFLGAVGSSPDVTELIEASDALRDADRRKDEFLATLAHELRNPLAPIRQAARLSRSPEASDAQRRWSQEVIERQVKHMALLLDDLLDVSRITRGKLELRRVRVDLGSVVAMALETARPLIDDRRQTVIQGLPAAPIMLDADPMRLAQVLANLLTNAAKYSEPGGIIELAAAREVDEIRIDVKDSGIGIEPALLPRVFEMFSQMQGSLDRAEGGLGIGLALVKGLVALHGGRVEAQSAGLGHGARFSVRLPLPGDAPGAPAGGGDDAAAPDARHARILVADDNRDAASSLATLLALDGHDVRVANDGARALVEAESFRPHIALLDIGMPRRNGYDVARTIRAAPWGQSMVLVAVTGWGQSEDKRRAKEAGFDHHFTKPLDLDVLGAFVTDALARQPAG
jgi:PAS domain S-box-containing protein